MYLRQGFLRKKIKELILVADYIFWILADPSKFKIIKPEKIKKVLIIHLGAVGELIVTTPIIRALKKNLNCKIFYMLKKGRESLLENDPDIEKILTYEDSFNKNLNKLKKEKFDLAILPQADKRFSFLCMKAGIPYRIGGFSGLKRMPSFFFTRRFFPIVNKNTVLKNLELLEFIGIKENFPKIKLFYNKKSEKKIKHFLKKQNIKDFVIVHPSFGSGTGNEKLWPLERYSEISNYLINKKKMKVILGVGMKEEIKIVSEIMKNIKYKKSVISASGKFNLSELICLIKMANLVVAPDTGISHIASAVGTPLINLMSYANEKEWHPWGDKNKIVNIYKPKLYEIRFFPIKIKRIGGMKDITTDEVKKAIDLLLK